MINGLLRGGRRSALALLLVAGAGTGASQVSDPPPPTEAPPTTEAEEDVGIGIDKRFRMTVPISIDGKGPYQFLIDTGAERTVISAELARELSLTKGKSAVMHSMSGVGEVSTVVIPKLQVSKKTVSGIHAPALKQVHIGAAGMLGIDTLQAQRITFDFERQKMSIAPSSTRERRFDRNEIVVTARSRLGRLVLVDASIDGEKLMVVLDTGAEVTIGNEALRRKLTAKGKLKETVPIELISVTGGRLVADYTQARKIRLGGLLIQNLPVGFAEVHPFKQLDLHDRPALLLGMDALRLFTRVSVDFANRKVRFNAPELRGAGLGIRLASSAGSRPGY
jgi:predicted aspartyl protease